MTVHTKPAPARPATAQAHLDALLVSSLLNEIDTLRRMMRASTGTLAETAHALRGVFAAAQQIRRQQHAQLRRMRLPRGRQQ